MADTADLKSAGSQGPCRFESGLPHQPFKNEEDLAQYLKRVSAFGNWQATGHL